MKELEGHWGVSAAPQAIIGQGGPVQPVEVAEEQTEFDVILESAGESKMGIIKIVREVTSLGLKEAKDKVEGAPTILKESVDKATAEDLKTRIEAAGGKVTIK